MKRLSYLFIFFFFLGGLFLVASRALAAPLNLRTYLPFDEGVDGSVAVNDGSDTFAEALPGGGVAFPSYSSTNTPGALVSDPYSLHFNGDDDQYVGVNQEVTSSFSVSFWFNPSVYGIDGPHFYNATALVDNEQAGVVNDWGIGWNGQQVDFGVGASGIDDYDVFSSSLLTDHWYHVVATWEKSTGKISLYINGSLAASRITPATSDRTTYDYYIGAPHLAYPFQFFSGFIDDYRLYNGVLTQAQVSALAAGQEPDIIPPLSPSSFGLTPSGTAAMLSWVNPGSDFSSTAVRRSTSTYPDEITDGTLVTSTVSASYSDTGLADGNYFYSLFALDTSGNASVAVTGSVYIDATPPTVPTNLFTYGLSNDVYQEVHWDPSSDAGVGLADPPYVLEWSTSSDFSGAASTTANTESASPTTALTDGTWYFRVSAVDVYGNVSAYSTSTLVMDTTGPVLTLNGDSNVTITQGGSYTDLGATAYDARQGNVTGSIVTTGTVDTATLGTYTITYSVRDDLWNFATPITRTVTVTTPSHSSSGGAGGVPFVAPTTAPITGSNGGALSAIVNGSVTGLVKTTSPSVKLSFNGGQMIKGMALSLSPDFAGASIVPYASETTFTLPKPDTYTLYVKFYSATGNSTVPLVRSIVYTAADGGQTPGAVNAASTSPSPAAAHFTRNLTRGSQGADVKALQQFLNAHGFVVALSGPGSLGHETILYGAATAAAVAKFQEAHAEAVLKPSGLKKGTGNFFAATRAAVNELLIH